MVQHWSNFKKEHEKQAKKIVLIAMGQTDNWGENKQKNRKSQRPRDGNPSCWVKWWIYKENNRGILQWGKSFK